MTTAIALSLRLYDATKAPRTARRYMWRDDRGRICKAPLWARPGYQAPRATTVQPRISRALAVATATLCALLAMAGVARAQCDELGPRLDRSMVTVCDGHVKRAYIPTNVVVALVDEIDGNVARIVWDGPGKTLRVAVVARKSLPSWARESMRVVLADVRALDGSEIR